MIIGFTSGRYKNETYFISKLNKLLSIGCNAIELHPKMNSLDDFDLSEKSVNLLNNKFDYVSLHAPARNFKINNSISSKEIFKKIDELIKKVSIKNVIIHPDIIEDFNILKDKDWPISLENMDCRKKDGRYVRELEIVFNKVPSANLVLDLNHCYTNDMEMKLADEILNKFSSRIVEYHISAYVGEDKLHQPFSTSNCDIILSKVSNKNTPLIIEVITDVLSNEELTRELSYIKAKLQK